MTSLYNCSVVQPDCHMAVPHAHKFLCAQVPSLGTKAAASSALDGRGGYSLGVSDTPNFAYGDYVPSSSHGYGSHKSDQLYGDKGLDYSGIDRRQYGERQSAYIGRDIPSDPAGRYAADPVGFGHQHQTHK